MKTNVLITMALMVCMMLTTGCSKSDDDPTPQYKLTKDNIVGVWRSGDYWVSFSSDGYMSAYLSDKCIAEGDYTVDGDTVKVKNGYYMIRMYGEDTRFVINNISESTLSLTATYNDLTILSWGDEGLQHQLTQGYTFAKTQETPCAKSNPLVGKICVLPMDVWYFKGTGPSGKMVSTPGTCTINVESYNVIDVWILPDVEDDEGYIAGDHLKYLYAYLPPKLYMLSIGSSAGYYDGNRPMKIYEPTFDADGSLTIPFTFYGEIDKYL